MSSFIELARRALNSNTTAAAAAVIAITLHQRHETADHDDCITSRTAARCNHVHQMSFNLDTERPIRQLDRHTSDAQITRSRLPKTKNANDLYSTYKVDWNTVLGEGAYGRVYPARHRNTGEKVCNILMIYIVHVAYYYLYNI